MSPRGRVGSLRKIAAGGIVGALALLTGLTAPAAAYPRPGTIELVSAGSDGAVGDSASLTPAISGDGRYVAFSSHASNLVAGDTNGRPDVFVYDRETEAAERVSVATDGAEGNSGTPLYPAISGDGRYVAFSSHASNLVAGDTNGREDVFVHDRETGTTERVSVASGGAEADHGSRDAAISGDGRYVAFSSHASNLVPGDANVAEDVFVYDRETGTTERVSVATNGLQGIARSLSPALSADGRYVAFSSFANLVPGDTNGREDVFVHDRETGTTERVSVASDGSEARGHSRDAAISADGRHVAFGSLAANLVPADTNGRQDV